LIAVVRPIVGAARLVTYRICHAITHLSSPWHGQRQLSRKLSVVSMYSPVHRLQGARHTVTTAGRVLTTLAL
jgi:hypothetical protein